MKNEALIHVWIHIKLLNLCYYQPYITGKETEALSSI